MLYAAFLAGQMTAASIRNFYTRALAGGGDPTPMFWTLLGFSRGLGQYPATTPTAGQWVFYLPAGAAIPSHVALAQGGDLAMSLWNQPNNISSMQRININALAQPGMQIFVGDPRTSW
ncbi:MAG: hypothetical protein RLZZ519_3181 [Bacteroidota bacterium]|jgi:hypothetical protein